MNPTPPATVDDPSEGVTVRATAPLQHRCPFADETDQGTVTVSWEVAGTTIELHSLAEYFRGWKDVPISHEAITEAIRDDLYAAGVHGVAVKTAWATAGMTVETESSP